VQFADSRHAADEVLERYSMGNLARPELAEFEEHLLVCESCQDRLAEEDSFRLGVRRAGAEPLPSRSFVRGRLPKLAWAVGLAAMGLAIFGGIQWRSLSRAGDPPAVILLGTTRGTENSTPGAAPAQKPLTLLLDVTDLQQGPAYTLSVVDTGGRPAFQSVVGPSQNDKLQAPLARGLPPGEYFVRLSNPAGELLREYALTVRKD
jgi:hypothetical protein